MLGNHLSAMPFPSPSNELIQQARADAQSGIGVERKEEYTSPRIRPTVGCSPSLSSRFKFNLEFAEPGFAVSFGYL